MSGSRPGAAAMAVIVPSWDGAACTGTDPALWFGPEDEEPVATAERERKAAEICTPCPILARCRNWALTFPVHEGVWGGLSEADRRSIRYSHWRTAVAA